VWQQLHFLLKTTKHYFNSQRNFCGKNVKGQRSGIYIPPLLYCDIILLYIAFVTILFSFILLVKLVRLSLVFLLKAT